MRGRGYLRGPQDIENTVVRAHERHAGARAQRRASVVEAYTPRARRGRARRRHRLDRGDDPAPPRREPQGRARRRPRGGRRASTRTCCRTGMRIVPFYDRTRLVDTTLNTVSHNMLEGARPRVSWCCGCSCARSRARSRSRVTMPLALLTAFVGLYYAGVPANLLSMGAIDFGILLDGAVILVENAYRHLAEEQPPPDERARRRRARRQGGACARRCSRCRSSPRR